MAVTQLYFQFTTAEISGALRQALDVLIYEPQNWMPHIIDPNHFDDEYDDVWKNAYELLLSWARDNGWDGQSLMLWVNE